jgi:hypothetical protein
MSIAIVDPANHLPGFKICFPEADYYAHPPDAFFTYEKAFQFNHMTPTEFKQSEGFSYLTDWNQIRSDRYDYLFIVMSLLDYDVSSPISKPYSVRMLQHICEQITDKMSFKKVVIFDVHDYDYDPAQLNLKLKPDLYFKRNYNQTRTYSHLVRPLPYLMFVYPCVMTILLTSRPNTAIVPLNQAVWCGALYDFKDEHHQVFRNREGIYNQIKNEIVTLTKLPYQFYLESIRKYKIGIDLCGVGDPNKRTFEILASGRLLFTNIRELNWGFEGGDAFLDDVIFTDGTDFKWKLNRLLSDPEHYQSCLNHQDYLVKKYMNKDWIQSYILRQLTDTSLN